MIPIHNTWRLIPAKEFCDGPFRPTHWLPASIWCINWLLQAVNTTAAQERCFVVLRHGPPRVMRCQYPVGVLQLAFAGGCARRLPCQHGSRHDSTDLWADKVQDDARRGDVCIFFGFWFLGSRKTREEACQTDPVLVSGERHAIVAGRSQQGEGRAPKYEVQGVACWLLCWA